MNVTRMDVIEQNNKHIAMAFLYEEIQRATASDYVQQEFQTNRYSDKSTLWIMEMKTNIEKFQSNNLT